MLAELMPKTVHQGDFIDTRDTARSEQLMVTLDAINRPMGRDVLPLDSRTRHGRME